LPGISSVFAKLRYVQGEIVLPTARTIYLAIACISLLACVIALLVALVFQMQSGRSASQVSVPGPYVAQVKPIDLGTVRARMSPPTGVRFVATQGIISSPIGDDTILGYFTAETPNGLASFPNDISILGGPDAPLFEPVGSSYPGPGTHTALRPGPQLIAEIDAELSALTAPKARRFSLIAIARDAFGNASSPVTITFSIVYGPSTAAAGAPAEHLTELQRLARDIALMLDPTRIPPNYYMDLYQHALREPERCSVDATNYTFVAQYRQAFEQLRTALAPQNIDAFYEGVCDAWRQSVSNAQAAEQNANAARASAIARNMALEAEAAIGNSAAKALRDIALGVAGSALIAFITISLFLAFLAMENHSKAMREAVEILAKAHNERGNKETSRPAS
jgi:hypothetical protein